MQHLRPITPLEIETVLQAVSSFRINKTKKRDVDDAVFNSMRLVLRQNMSDWMIPDDERFLKMVAVELRNRFILAIGTPGINEGSRAASSNMEPITQNVLRSGHSAGTKQTESPIMNILKMKIDLVTEHIYTLPASGLPPPEWYIGRPGRVVINNGPKSLDKLIEFAMENITSPIESMVVGTAQIVIVENTNATYCKGIAWDISASPEMVFSEVVFSIQEAIKLRYTPYKTLHIIRQHLESPGGTCHDIPFHCNIINVTPTTFTIALTTQNPTITFDAAMSIRTIGSSTKNLQSFEVLQIPTTQAFTCVEEIHSSLLGYLVPRRKDGTVARSWRIYMQSPTMLIPAKHVCSFLVHLGFQIISCDRNAAGRCDFLHVAEYLMPLDGNMTDLPKAPIAVVTGPFMKWIEAECDAMSKWEYFASISDKIAFIESQIYIPSNASVKTNDSTLPEASDSASSQTSSQTSTKPIIDDMQLQIYANLRRVLHDINSGNLTEDLYGVFRKISSAITCTKPDDTKSKIILDWKMTDTNPFSRYSVYRYLRFTGHYKNLAEIFSNPAFDWECTFSDNVPATAKLLCTQVSRQVMDYLWSIYMSSDKVSQTAVDYVTAYGSGTGPKIQPVSQSAINQGGPLTSANENPIKVFMTAAILSDTYQAAGSQSDMVTGNVSQHNGTSSVTLRVIGEETASSGDANSHNGIKDAVLKQFGGAAISGNDCPEILR